MQPWRRSQTKVALYAATLLLILILAGWLRLQRLDLVEFKNDEALALLHAEDLVQLGRIPLTGLVTSVGMQSPPTFLYLLAPVVAISRDPVVATAAIGLVNVAGVAGVALLGARALSPVAGLAAGLVLATNPWAVVYSRKVWEQDVLAPWAVLLFFALDRSVVAGRPIWAAASIPIFAVGIQIHYSFFLLAPFVLPPLGMLIAGRRWTHLLVGASIAVATTSPYLIHLLQTDWGDVRTALAAAQLPAEVDGSGPAFVQGMIGTWENGNLIDIRLESVMSSRLVTLAAGLQAALVALGIVGAIAGVLALSGTALRTRRLRSGGLLLWLMVPPVLTIRHGVPLYEHYFLFVLPAGALLCAAGVQWLIEQRAARWTRPALAIVIGSMLIAAAVHAAMVTRFLDSLSMQVHLGYDAPVGLTRRVAEQLSAFALRAGARSASVELKTRDSVAVAYFIRPTFPNVEVINLGEVGAGERVANLEWSPVTPAPSSAELPAIPDLLPGPADLVFQDGVRVLASAALSGWVPGENAGLAIVWAAPDAASNSTPTKVTFEVALYGPDHVPVGRGVGLTHQALDRGLVCSWFSFPTETDAPIGDYTFMLGRLDAIGEPIVYIDRGGSAATEWRSRPVAAAPPKSN